jgi:hypothetical protein
MRWKPYVISFLVPGAGHLVIGRYPRAILFFAPLCALGGILSGASPETALRLLWTLGGWLIVEVLALGDLLLILTPGRTAPEQRFLEGIEALLKWDRRRAENRFRRWTELHPKDPAGWLYLGWLCRLHGRYREAGRHLKRSRKLDRDEEWTAVIHPLEQEVRRITEEHS